MKLSLALGPRTPISRQVAWGCLTTNLAFPGFGSLIGGRSVGYFQVPFTIVGLGLTMLCGIPALIWGFSNFSRIQQNQDDPFAALAEMWLHFRWSILGMAIFFFGLLWALATSLSIMSKAPAAGKNPPGPLPPML